MSLSSRFRKRPNDSQEDNGRLVTINRDSHGKDFDWRIEVFHAGTKDRVTILKSFESYAKSKAKGMIDSWIEEPAWRDYFVAESYRIGIHHLYAIANEGVIALLKEQSKLQSLYDQTLAQYDPNDVNYFKGTETSPLKQEQDYVVRFYFKGPIQRKRRLLSAAVRPVGSVKHFV